MHTDHQASLTFQARSLYCDVRRPGLSCTQRRHACCASFDLTMRGQLCPLTTMKAIASEARNCLNLQTAYLQLCAPAAIEQPPVPRKPGAPPFAACAVRRGLTSVTSVRMTALPGSRTAPCCYACVRMHDAAQTHTELEAAMLDAGHPCAAPLGVCICFLLPVNTQHGPWKGHKPRASILDATCICRRTARGAHLLPAAVRPRPAS